MWLTPFRRILDDLAENPLFLRNARWAYCDRAAGVPRGMERLAWGILARFFAFAVVFQGGKALVLARGGDWAAGGFFVAWIAWGVSSLAARLARGYPILLGLEYEPMVRLRTEARRGTLEPLMLARLTSREAFAGFAWPDYLVFLTLIVEHVPLAWFIPWRFWTYTLEFPTEFVWLAVPLAAADGALHLLTMNLMYWNRALGAAGRRSWKRLASGGLRWSLWGA
ncbi:MAG: hypothetical protein NTW86_29430 [Candidatus Sumerlaeota bacterium]|nr:hypothetical protein [Candidatus Sumerlaeota bacterium]